MLPSRLREHHPLRLGGAALLVSSAALLAASLAFLRWQERLLFRPGRDALRDADLAVDGLIEVEVTATDGCPTYASIRDPAPGRPVLLYLHGNTGAHPNRAARIRLLAQGPWGLCFPEYRGYGRNGGRPGERGFLADAEGALRLLADRGTPAARVLVYGKSLGSAVAAALAARHRVGAVVLDSPFTALADVVGHHLPFLPVRQLLRHRFDVRDDIGRIRSPVLVLLGARDRVVPPRLGRRVYDLLPEPKRLVVAPDVGHEGMLLGPGHDALRSFLFAHGLAGPVAPSGEASPPELALRR